MQKEKKKNKNHRIIRPPLWPLSYTSILVLEMGFEPTTKGLLVRWSVVARKILVYKEDVVNFVQSVRTGDSFQL